MQSWLIETGHTVKALTCIVAACVLLPAEATGRNIGVHFDPLSWEVVLEYEGVSERREGFPDSGSNQFTEKLEIEQSGFVLSPSIFDFSITLTPTILQEQFDKPVQDERIEGTYLDYDINLGALRGAKAPVDLAAGASRNTRTLSSNLGNRTDFTLENRSLELGVKLPAFPWRLSYGERLLEQTFQSGHTAALRHRDEFERSVRLQGRSSKLQIEVERRWFDDRISDNDYNMLQQTAHHKLLWGKNSRLITQQSYYNRVGAHSFKRFSIFERLRLQHLDNLSSNFDYDYSSITQNDVTKVYSGMYTANYQPTEKLNLGLSVQGRNSDMGVGTEKEYGGALNLSYARDIFDKGTLNFGLSGSSLQTDRQSSGSTFESLDVSYSVPATLIVLLDTRAIETGSIVVTDAVASQVFLEGVDYIVRALSGDRTELQILTSGLIAAGDVILISYSAAAQPPAEFNTGTVSANISLGFEWVRLYHSSRISEQTLQSGSFSEGQNDLRDHTTGLELTWSRGWFEATARAETHSFDSGDYSTESDTLAETAQIHISPLANIFLSASQISFVSDGRETELSQWDVNLEWAAMRGLVVKPFVSGWDRREGAGQFEERLTAGVKVTWQLRQIDVNLDMSHIEHVAQNIDRTEQRIGVRVVRRSR